MILNWPGLELTVYHIPLTIGMLYFMLRPVIAGAPYVPTLKRHTVKLLSFAEVRNDDVLYELGCGDGRFSISAVRAGVGRSVGYDILGTMVLISRLRAHLAGLSGRCEFRKGDIRELDLRDATLVYVYLMPGITDKLAAGPLLTLKPGARILCSTFPIETDKFPGFRLLKKDTFGSIKAFLYERADDL